MDTSTIAVTVESFSGKILDYALLLAAIGTIAMALLELIKSVTYWRRHFHRRRLERWLATAPDSKAAYQQLMLLAAGGPAERQCALRPADRETHGPGTGGGERGAGFPLEVSRVL